MIAKKLSILAAMSALIVLLAACNSQPASPTTPGVSDIGTPTAGNDIPISPADTATIPANATMAPGTLLTFSITGGFAGFNTVFTLQESGDYTLNKRGEQPKSGKLNSGDIAKVKQQLDAARSIGDLKERYDQGNVADDIYRTVMFDQNGSLKSVTVAEQGGKGLAPAPLQQLIATVNDFTERP